MAYHKNLLQDKKKITLEDLSSYKNELLEEIRARQKGINDHVQTMLEPLVSTLVTGSSYLKSFRLGLTIIDAIGLGFTIFRKVRRLF